MEILEEQEKFIVNHTLVSCEVEDLLVGSLGNASVFLVGALGEEQLEKKGAVSVKYHGQTDVALEVFQHKTGVALCVTTQKMLSVFANDVMSLVFAHIHPKRVIVLDSVPAASLVHYRYEGDTLLHLSNSHSKMTPSCRRIPSGFVIAGLGGSTLMLTEILRIPCLAYLLVTTEYSISTYSVTQFDPVKHSAIYLSPSYENMKPLIVKANHSLDNHLFLQVHFFNQMNAIQLQL